MESDDRKPDYTVPISVHVFSRPLRNLEEAAELHRITRVDAFNQAVSLWTLIASRGWIGKTFAVTMEEEASYKDLSGWKRLLARLIPVSVVQRSTIHITLPGDSIDIIVEEALERLRDQE